MTDELDPSEQGEDDDARVGRQVRRVCRDCEQHPHRKDMAARRGLEGRKPTAHFCGFSAERCKR